MKTIYASFLLTSIIALASFSPLSHAGKKSRKGASNAAKAACLKSNPDLKGKELKSCIKLQHKAKKA